ncbi:MAG: hypothetical protein OXC18_23305 [Desulfurellaceae bacterium]|nr:hypothetical protein [Desulfurellaceae bacterium]
MSNFTSPAIQAMNLVRYIGDEVVRLGKPIEMLDCADIQEIIGAPSGEFVEQLIEDLKRRGTIKGDLNPEMGGSSSFFSVTLTLDGWEQYEAEKRGEFSGNYGFIAMQFGDPKLDPFMKDIVKPAVKEGIGYKLVDMRDVGRAGVIDNIMRTQIRDAAFVIVDLTHGNPGAYWEAGYAEGLGKPVLYICEKATFDEDGTHFDTNHCTTIFWSRDDDEDFKQKLIATLRRSLNL